MNIQVSTDRHIQGGAELNQQVQDTLESAIGRFADRITRVEVHLSDENSSAKTHGDDIRCMMEARIAGMQPVVVEHRNVALDQAIEEAASKLKRLLDSTLGRKDDPKGRTSFSGQ
jgi:ribosome-associated translation inhibitor RaiA